MQVNWDTIFEKVWEFVYFKSETGCTDCEELENINQWNVVIIVMELLRIENNQVNDIETYLEQDPQKRHFSSLI